MQTAITVQKAAPPLTPKMAPWMSRFVQTAQRADQLINEYGSPLHIAVTSEFVRNVQSLLNPLKERGVSGGLYFARKANKLPWFVEAARDAGIGVDTASLTELEETLSLKVPAARTISTAIGKSDQLINCAIAYGATIVIENPDELAKVTALANACSKAARIGLRFAGYKVKDRTVSSRFGFPIEEAHKWLTQVSEERYLDLYLLHAHLDRYDTTERATACRQLIKLSDLARTLGLNITTLDLGGGILMRYIDEESQWSDFLDALKGAVAGKRESFTYRNEGFGYQLAGDNVVGQPDLYPMWNAISKERFVSAILDHCEAEPLHKELTQRNLQLFFEPGRALLDNTAITLASVRFNKTDTEGNRLVGLAMNRMNLRPFRAEFCSDPLFLTKSAQKADNEAAFLVGNLCSESDFIYRRRILLQADVRPDDVVCFFNTAGYLAHHMEIGTHGDELPKNVLLDESSFEVLKIV